MIEKEKKRSRSKSPFGKLFSRKKEGTPEPEQAGEDEVPVIKKELAAGTSAEVPHEEGVLVRKHERDGDKKAGNRSWDKVYVVLHGSTVSCYKDQKHAKSDPNTRIHHELAMDLVGATCEVAVDYTKRPNVFRVRLVTGSEYLFQAKDSVERDLWIGKMNSVTGSEGTGMPSRSQTLPARTDDSGREEHKKRGFFTLKKK